TEPSGQQHLLQEGKPASAIHYVGHVMVDNLLYQVEQLARADTSNFETSQLKTSLGNQSYGVVTLHRPSNVDSPDALERISLALKQIAKRLPLVFPAHPRTQNNLKKFNIDLGPNIILMGPQAYMPFLHLWKDATLVLTDSGGLQEETTALGVPCVTIRKNTERPVTVEEGTNTLAGTRPERILAAVDDILGGRGKQGRRPHLWDGNAARRIVEILTRELHP
ncbi:UDP-N-acetyl glucosamine 2-epimerase, partial [Nitrosomonas europaea]